jgi:hypothetical protein
MTRSLSDLLLDLQSHNTGDYISFKALLEAFHERGFGFFLFLIALPAALPIPAIGLNTIIALPLLLLTAQQFLGRHTIWVPRKWQSKTVSKAKMDNFIHKATPWVKRLEILSKPRLSFMTQGFSSNLIGFMGFLMALAVAIPLPLTNTIPSVGIAGMALGVLMRDGVAVIVGGLIGMAWVTMLVILFIFFGAEAVDIVKGFFKSPI